jgi:hypothetical protein
LKEKDLDENGNRCFDIIVLDPTGILANKIGIKDKAMPWLLKMFFVVYLSDLCMEGSHG